MNGAEKEPELQPDNLGKAGTPGPLKDWLEEWRHEQERDLVVRGDSLRIWHLILLVAAVAVYCWLVVMTGLWIIPFTLLLFVAFLVGSGVMVARRRSAQQDSLLAILAIAAERGMPLAPTVAAFADQYGGKYRRRIMNLAAHLDSGCSLPEALERVPRVVSRDAVLLAHAGHRTGRLAQALRMAASSRASHLPIWMAIASRFAYILGLLLALQTICSFLLYFIVPKFEAIFKDFGVPLPGVTIFIIEASHFLVKYLFITGWVPGLEIVLLVFLPFSFAGWVNYDVPLFDRLLKRRHTALILRSLSLSVEAGQPIETGLIALSSHYPTWWVRRRLIRADDEVQHGGSWIDALERQGLIRATDAEVLFSASAVGNLAWAMRELAETGERRLAFRFQAVIQTLFPLVVVCIGAFVFLLAFAFFSPLVMLIGRLTG
ncbi:MAG: type II secretion system F family protein [Isosphaeraceae bacterium]